MTSPGRGRLLYFIRAQRVNGQSHPITSNDVTSFRSAFASVGYRHHRRSSTKVATSWPGVFQRQEEDNATWLVDRLLSYTRHLMGEKNTQRIHLPQHMVAFSGGVDSSLVAALVQQSADTNVEHVQAVLGVSPAVPREQVELARRVAQHLNIFLVEVPTTEGTDEVYRANTGQACLACKTHLYTCLQAVALHATKSQRRRPSTHHQHRHLHDNTHLTLSDYDNNEVDDTMVRLYNGTNADDLLDSTRVGLLAAAQFKVSSPLQYITKAQVRLAARHLGLPNYHMAASPCLRSRLALGVAAVPEHLQRIEQAERHVRQALQLPDTASFRVRLLSGQRARLEVEEEFMELANGQLQREGGLQDFLTKQLGFADVSLAVFKSGSVARPVISTVTPPSSSSLLAQIDDDEEDNINDERIGSAQR